MIDKLVENLAAIQSGEEVERRRLAIAIAVSTLSEYAGQPLFVRKNGQTLQIEGLWR